MRPGLTRATSASLAALIALAGCSDDTGFQTPDARQPAADGSPPGPDGPRPQFDSKVGSPVTLSVATFNVRNFFDEVDDPKHFDDVLTPKQVQDKIKALGVALRHLAADVVALQEVEHRPLLDRLKGSQLGSLGYKHVRLVEGNDARGIDVALLSRFPIPSAMTHKGDRFPGVGSDTKTYGFSRDCLEATIEPAPGRKLLLLINHLRANSWKDPQDAIKRRKAQAAQVRRIADNVLKHKPNANLAVIGDLNDVPASDTLKLIQNGKPFLFDLVTLLPPSQRWTTFYDKKQTQIDYILVAPGLRADLVDGSVQILHQHAFKTTSDHYPVKARFRLQ